MCITDSGKRQVQHAHHMLSFLLKFWGHCTRTLRTSMTSENEHSNTNNVSKAIHFSITSVPDIFCIFKIHRIMITLCAQMMISLVFLKRNSLTWTSHPFPASIQQYTLSVPLWLLSFAPATDSVLSLLQGSCLHFSRLTITYSS